MLRLWVQRWHTIIILINNYTKFIQPGVLAWLLRMLEHASYDTPVAKLAYWFSVRSQCRVAQKNKQTTMFSSRCVFAVPLYYLNVHKILVRDMLKGLYRRYLLIFCLCYFMRRLLASIVLLRLLTVTRKHQLIADITLIINDSLVRSAPRIFSDPLSLSKHA